MKKLLLFLIAAITIVLCTGKELHTFFEDSSAEEYTIYKDENGKTVGETITFPEEECSLQDLYKKFYVVYRFSDNVDDIEIIYAYSPVLKGVEIVDNKPVNLQITRHNGVLTVSNPINMGSY